MSIDNSSMLLGREELSEFCKSESLSVEGLHQIIDRYGWTPDNTHHISDDYEFFHAACRNERINEGIIQCLIEYFPGAASAVDDDGEGPLHFACINKSVTLNIIQLLVDAAPNSVRSKDNYGYTPLYDLCHSVGITDEAAAIQILKLLIEKCPEALRHPCSNGNLPIHLAAWTKSPEFCRVLIEAYPGSDQIPDANGALPFHIACQCNTLDTVEYLYQQYPGAIDHAATDGFYPIHYAVDNIGDRDKPAAAVEIVRFLLDCNPNEKLKECHGQSLLRFACGRKYNDLNIEAGIQMIKTLFDAHPDSVRSEDNEGWTPLHALCNSVGRMNEAAAIQILKLFIEKCPEAVRHADSSGDLPIHLAACRKSPEFCRVLIEAYPGSEQITTNNGALPLHNACGDNAVATVEYLYRLYPDAIDHETAEGHYPIHFALDRDKPAAAVEIVHLLLDCGPNEKLKQFHGRSLLYYACTREYNNSNITAGIQIIKTLYDAHPEAIENIRIVSNIQGFHDHVQAFIRGELVYARQAEDHRLMMTPDNNGQLPLHRALQNNVRLGSIKLLVKGNPSAIRTAEVNLAMPLHIACEHHNSTEVIEHLLNLDRRTLRAVDIDNNTALHYACRGEKHDTITLLLEKHAASVSKRNTYGKLPINLLWESDEVSDRESVEYTGSVFQLLRAHPEMLAIRSNSTRDGKKRKRNEEV